MGKLFTKEVGNILTTLMGNVLNTVMGKVLDIYKYGYSALRVMPTAIPTFTVVGDFGGVLSLSV